ncbi:uncharacterized protein CXQ87_002314 [Candidozyma duobushaemuli]|uniref:Uncharacterized protein n=1 Tax=Candidozyma duobushaemuli TaxID=1231522 RepID=A0A2V1A887_9ASCO|nr:uncharacterized protein CXQ87_002314 [[Candida] duobushaemulonis]PVH14188.1 hypothetical protein CXQ87_002314 [[Candida] duobushaemulonis]
MSALSEHSFFEQEYFAGFGVHSDTDWDGISLPSSQTLLTYPNVMGIFPRGRVFSSSPQGWMTRSPRHLPLPQASRERSYRSSSSGHFLSDYSCQVRLVTEAFQGKDASVPSQEEASTSSTETNSAPPIDAVDAYVSGPANSNIPEITVPDSRSPPSVQSVNFPTQMSPDSQKEVLFPQTPQRTNSSTMLGHSVGPTTSQAPESQPTPCPCGYQSEVPVHSHIVTLQIPPQQDEVAITPAAQGPVDVTSRSSPDSEMSEQTRACKGIDKTLKKKRVIRNLQYPKVQKESPFEAKVLSMGEKVEVRIRFEERKAFYKVYCQSQDTHEYRLPIFRTLSTLSQMMSSQRYSSHISIKEDPHILVIKERSSYSVSLRRFESRLTFQQMAHILGLSRFKITLIRVIEAIFILLFEQLCGLKLTSQRWTKLESSERKTMTARVYRFSKHYFPTINTTILDIIMRRASYSKAQLELKGRRLKKNKYKKRKDGTSLFDEFNL